MKTAFEREKHDNNFRLLGFITKANVKVDFSQKFVSLFWFCLKA